MSRLKYYSLYILYFCSGTYDAKNASFNAIKYTALSDRNFS